MEGDGWVGRGVLAGNARHVEAHTLRKLGGGGGQRGVGTSRARRESETVTDFLPGCGRSCLAAALSQEVVQDGTVRAICNSSPWQGPHRRHSLPIHMKLVQGERGPEWFC